VKERLKNIEMGGEDDLFHRLQEPLNEKNDDADENAEQTRFGRRRLDKPSPRTMAASRGCRCLRIVHCAGQNALLNMSAVVYWEESERSF
jgi:hypothetical protein